LSGLAMSGLAFSVALLTLLIWLYTRLIAYTSINRRLILCFSNKRHQLAASCSRTLQLNYHTPADNYYITMDTYNDYGSCSHFDHLESLLAGSGQTWYSTCRRKCVHTLTIQVGLKCSGGSSWTLQLVAFRVKGVRNVKLNAGNVQVFSVCRGDRK